MSSNQSTFDALVRHQILLLRRGNGMSAELLDILDEMRTEIVSTLSSTSLTRYQYNRLNLLYADIDAIIDASVAGWGEQLVLKLDELVSYESQFAVNMLDELVDYKFVMPSANLLAGVVQGVTMELTDTKGKTQVLTVDEMITGFSASMKRDIKKAIQKGLVSGKTSGEMAAAINKFAKKRTKANSYAIVRTSTNAITSNVRSAVYNANKNVIMGEEWVSVLDGRTTIVCANRDGTIYPVGEAPACPRHWNCRSLLVPKVNPKYSLVSKSGSRASVYGPVSTATTYEGWLNRQSASFQDEFLGHTRGKLLRSGQLKLEQFVDDSGRTLTLNQLVDLYGVQLD